MYSRYKVDVLGLLDHVSKQRDLHVSPCELVLADSDRHLWLNSLVPLLVSLQTVAGLEVLQTVQTWVALDVVVVPLDVQLQLVAGAQRFTAVWQWTGVHYIMDW
jgi:hypothetical protein